MTLTLTPITDWLRGPQAERSARWLTLPLVIWLAWLLADLAWQVIPEPEIPPVASTPAVSTPASDARPQTGPRPGAEIARLHLFGKAEPALARRPAQVPSNAPDTRLNLQLRGIFALEDKARARAIIGQPGRPDEDFGIDDSISNGVTVADILADRVILLRNGQHETLRMPRDTLKLAFTDASAVSPPPPADEDAPEVGSARAGSILKEYRRKLRTDGQAYQDLFKFSQANRDGRMEGYRVFPGRNKELWDQLGLRPGDVITEINGVTLSGYAQALQAVKSVYDGDSLSLTVRRGTRSIPMQFTLE